MKSLVAPWRLAGPLRPRVVATKCLPFLAGVSPTELELTTAHFINHRNNLQFLAHYNCHDVIAAERILQVAARTVRVVAAFTHNTGVRADTVVAASGIAIGRHVVTSAAVVRAAAPVASAQLFVGDGVTCSLTPLANLAYWAPALVDDCMTAAVRKADESVRTLDIDGCCVPEGADIAVLRLAESDADCIDRVEPRLENVGSLFAASAVVREDPSCLAALGYPSRPDDSLFLQPARQLAAEDAANSSQSWLSDILLGYERLVMLSAVAETTATRTLGSRPAAGDTADGGSLAASGLRSVSLLPHRATALNGMQGGPILNAVGQIVGLQADRSHDSRVYNTYVGVDHPALRTAIELICAAKSNGGEGCC